ncbi:MAG: hypothetical protein JWO38_4538 [Gemmataceae bacterium]|nr:hypothetical protein [Gemmataceae bacterium]
MDLQWIEATLAQNKFRNFVEYFWPCVSNDPFVSGYHLDCISEHRQAVAEGKISRLCINLANLAEVPPWEIEPRRPRPRPEIRVPVAPGPEREWSGHEFDPGGFSSGMSGISRSPPGR